MSVPAQIDYQPLSTEEEQIRTLVLHAGKATDPIKCSLHVISLSDASDYEALSYTWGDVSVTRPIEVQGAIFEATVNLERALRHLRDPTHDQTLWVDAVCINQNDIEEKSKQVAMMGTIYKDCSRVRIWLGCDENGCALQQPLRRVDSMFDDTPEQQDPFEIVRSLANDEHILDWACFQKDEKGLYPAYRSNAKFERAWKGFLNIGQSAWWTRMWTIQEVVLPTSGLLTYDTFSVSLDAITTCGVNYYKHVWDCCSRAPEMLPHTTSTELDEVCSSFFSLDRDRNMLSGDEYFDIQDQHIAYGFRQCQNPRDKVYGLLALVGDISKLDLWLTPDYSKSVGEVFHDATIAMLYREVKTLKCLTGTQYGPSSKKWASWVRDFGTMTQIVSDIESNRTMIYELFDASKGTKARYELFQTWPQEADEQPHQAGLGLIGTRVGTVASVFAENKGRDSDEDLLEQRQVFGEWLKASDIDLEQYRAGQQGPDTTMRFWRTILGGVMSVGRDSEEYSDWRRFTTEAMGWMDIYIAWVFDGVSMSNQAFAMDRTLLISTDARCYFRTEDGGQGLCYPSVQKEDEIWVMNGSKVPCVIRRIKLSDNESTTLRPQEAYGVGADGVYGLEPDYKDPRGPYQHYYLIGDCYLDGCMDGEASAGVKELVVLV
ncbi:heterokaryon incompatibility protein-domain-containing protein [Phaeosphaeria sp. MPI-PUGE-AT-0046c]|nr:heterokaryon incompatibility protein-domain-containing protein [Phaeosphaeria sp. MPI-PUGE-AT-0046c]